MGSHKELTVPGRYENIKRICEFVSAGAREAGLPDSEVFHVELACDEACTNIIEHAYQGEDAGDIFVEWQQTAKQFVIIIEDNGRSFDPAVVPKPPAQPDDPDELKVGGLGLHFMKKLMDEVDFSFKGNRNRLTMKKNRQQ